MARVSDQDIVNQLDTFHEDPYLLDLRDARALLREALGYVDEYTRLANDFVAEDVLRRGNQHLEGYDEQN